jgi:hypothetical protein
MSKAKTRMLRLQQLKIRLLETGSMHYKDLLAEFKVHTATIFRDLEELGAVSDDKGIWRYTPTDEDIRIAKLIIP